MAGLSLKNLSTIKKMVANHVLVGFKNIRLISKQQKIVSGTWCCHMKETIAFTFFTIFFTHVAFPQSSNCKSK